MKPAKAAIQLSHLWRGICPEDAPFPVDCRKLAEALNVTVRSDSFENDFEAMLFIKGKKRIIVHNDDIREKGRKNFTISHELGHLSLHTNREEFRCSANDLNDNAPHPENIEQEANLFAANLLMPADDFRAQIGKATPSLSLVSDLANNRYETTLTATCNRIIDLFDSRPLAVVRVRDNAVIQWRRTDAMKWTGFGFRKEHKLENAALFPSETSQEVDSSLWLNAKNSKNWEIYQSAIHMPYYGETLILLSASRKHEYEHEEEQIDDSWNPSFKR